MRDPIPARVKLAATIRFLSTGANYADLQHVFRIHKSTLSTFIPDVCKAIYTGKFFFLCKCIHSRRSLVTHVCLSILIICRAAWEGLGIVMDCYKCVSSLNTSSSR